MFCGFFEDYILFVVSIYRFFSCFGCCSSVCLFSSSFENLFTCRLVVFFALANALLEWALNFLLLLLSRVKRNVAFESFAEYVVDHCALEPNCQAYCDHENGVKAIFP